MSNAADRVGDHNLAETPPLVSVVIVTYNRAELLPRSVGSVIRQKDDRFELVIVDDGSTDSTADVVRDLTGGVERYRYVRLDKNQGIGNARQIGLQEARGRFIALLDSDDLWLPEKLKQQIDIMEKYPHIDILFGDWRNINHVTGHSTGGFEWTRAGMRYLNVHPLGKHVYQIDQGLEIGLLRDNFIGTSTVMLRSGLIERTGGYKPALVTGEDHEFLWRAAVLGARFAYIDLPLAERHIDTASVTTDRLKAAEQILIALRECRRTSIAAGRTDLLSHIRAAELRAYRRIMRRYGERAQPGKVVRAYLASLRVGLSFANLGFLFLCIAGPGAIKVILSHRAGEPGAEK